MPDPHPLTIARLTLELLTGHSDATADAINRATATVCAALGAGDHRCAVWVLERAEQAVRTGQDRLTTQCRPMLRRMHAVMARRGDLAARVMHIADAIGESDLRDQAAEAVSLSLRAAAKPVAA